MSLATLLTDHLGFLVEKGPHVTGNTGMKLALNIPRRNNERLGFRIEEGLEYTKLGHIMETDNWRLEILTLAHSVLPRISGACNLGLSVFPTDKGTNRNPWEGLEKRVREYLQLRI